MQKTYKKLFNIKYNNKIFTIFLDENNRRTFLEIDNEGNYKYPFLEDFIYLHNVYNNRDNFILYSIKKFTYEEKVKIASGLLAVNILISGIASNFSKTQIEVNNKTGELVISEVVNAEDNTEEKKYIQLNSKEDITDWLGYETVSVEEVHNAIDNNQNIDNKYKIIAHEIVSKLVCVFPNIDLRIFYENMKTLKIVENDIKNIHNKVGSGCGGYYQVAVNEIVVSNNSEGDVTIYHELMHTIKNIYYNDDIIHVDSSCWYGRSLDEAMNSRLTSIIKKDYSYSSFQTILEYFETCVEFTYEDYLDKGIWYLIELLKENYKEVDIDYLINSLDTMKDTVISQGIEGLKDSTYYYNESFLEELFKICIANIEKYPNNIYESYCNFVIALDSEYNDKQIREKYFNKYNEELKKLGYTNLLNYENITNFCSRFNGMYLINIDGNIYNLLNRVFDITDDGLIKYTYTYYDYNANKITLETDKNYEIHLPLLDIEASIEYEYIKNNKNFKIEECLKNIASVQPLFYCEKQSINYNNNTIANEKITDVFVLVGTDENNNFGYILKDNKGNMLYQTTDSIKNIVYINSLNKFIDNNYNEDIELSKYFNDEYLKYLIYKNNCYFNNMCIINNDINVISDYNIIINDDKLLESIPVSIKNFYIFKNINNEVELFPFGITYKTDNDVKKISFKEILEYYNILNKEQNNYNFTKEEINDLIQNYLNDISKTKTR